VTRTVTIGGFMGVGKTTVGRLLADRLHVSFVDLDAEVEALCGRTPAQVFAADGEAAFRTLETTALESVLAGPPVVLALGGGTLHEPQNQPLILDRSDLFVLWVELDILRVRLGQRDEDRPLWSDASALFAERAPGYRGLGHLVDGGDASPAEVVEQVMEVLSCS
jgi:shikimate kinase